MVPLTTQRAFQSLLSEIILLVALLTDIFILDFVKHMPTLNTIIFDMERLQILAQIKEMIGKSVYAISYTFDFVNL